VATVLQRTPSTASSMTSGSFAEMTAFIREERAFRESQRQEWEAKLEAQRQEWEAKLEAQRQEWEAKLETQLQEREATLQKAWTAKLKGQRSRRDASDARVLQARFEALHTSKLLSDDELYILENLVFDNVQDSERGEEGESHSTVGSLVRLCELATSDAGLARQLRRKYI
jgi:Skp family chaperone for outer membrane proteins